MMHQVTGPCISGIFILRRLTNMVISSSHWSKLPGSQAMTLLWSVENSENSMGLVSIGLAISSYVSWEVYHKYQILSNILWSFSISNFQHFLIPFHFNTNSLTSFRVKRSALFVHKSFDSPPIPYTLLPIMATTNNTPLSENEQLMLGDICNTLKNARLSQCPNCSLTGISGSTHCHGFKCGSKLPGSISEVKVMHQSPVSSLYIWLTISSGLVQRAYSTLCGCTCNSMGRLTMFLN